MSIRFYCPSGHRLSVTEKHAGETIRCPRCRQKVVVPAASSSDSAKGTKSKSDAESEQETVESEQTPKDETDEKPNSTPPEQEKPRSKPPPLPHARKSARAKDDPTQPKQKPVPKVEVPDRPDAGHDGESVLDSEAPKLKDRLKPQRASKEWTEPESPEAPPKAPPKVPPKLPAPKAPPDAGQEPAGEAARTSESLPPKTRPARSGHETEDEEHKQEEPASRRGRRDRKRSKREERDEAPEAESLPPEPPEPDAARRHPAREARPKRTPRRRGPKMMPPNVYQADRGSLVTIRGLAAILALVVLFSLLPVGWLTARPYFREAPAAASEDGTETAPVEFKSYLNLETAPGWARVVILVAVIQVFYIAWMLAAPDWAGVWVVMVVFAVVSTAYGMGTAMAITWPVEKPMLLGVGDEFRTSAKYWCGSVLAVMSLATYLCGRTSAKWRRMCELELAGRRRAPLPR